MAAPNVNSKTSEQDKDYWATPTEIYKGALKYFLSKGLLIDGAEYGVDVCASKHNTKHSSYISEQEDALVSNWVSKLDGGKVAWCNPPYSRGMKEKFIAKALLEAGKGLNTIMLLPNDTSAKWFSKCVRFAKAVAFICDGRIGFINNATGERSNGNNAGSILVLFGGQTGKVAKTLYVTKQKLEGLGND